MAKKIHLPHKKMEETLKAHGLRSTPQRLQIALRVLPQHQHFSADDLVAWSSKLKFKLSRATVYNTLNEFVAVGLLRSFYCSSMDKLIFDSNTGNHFHFLDTVTNQIFDIDSSSLIINPNALTGFQIEGTEVFFRGKKL
jgi:Fur family iron response transcriptional regulator